MKVKRELLQILIGALLLALFMELGWLSPTNSFLGNVATAVIMFVVVRVVALILSVIL